MPYFSIPDNVVDSIKKIQDKYALDELNRKLANEDEAKRILNENGYTHSGNVIDYDEAVEIITEILNQYKK